jgi:adenylate kinase family enzyme
MSRQNDPVQRVVIVGSGGAGESTLAVELGRRTNLPVVHLDHHFWHPGWVETPRDEWRAVQQELFAGDEWIADGN